MNSKCSQYFTS